MRPDGGCRRGGPDIRSVDPSAGLGGSVLALAFLAAQPYPGVTVDSGEYLAVADGLVNGHGYTMPYVGYDEAFRVLEDGERVPMTQFPPLYPTLLAMFNASGLSLLGAARAIGGLAYAGTVLAACLAVWGYTAPSSVRTADLWVVACP